MKKILLLYVIMIILYGCNNKNLIEEENQPNDLNIEKTIVSNIKSSAETETEVESIEMKPLSYYLREHYYEGEEININALRNAYMKSSVYVNSKLFEEDNLILEVGYYSVEVKIDAISSEDNNLKLMIYVESEYLNPKNLSLSSDEVYPREFYRYGDTITVNSLANSFFQKGVIIEDKEYYDTLPILSPGVHNASIFLFDKLGNKSNTVQFDLNIISEDADEFIEVYRDFQNGAPDKIIVLKSSIADRKVVSQMYYHTSEGVSLWNQLDDGSYYCNENQERLKELPLEICFADGTFETVLFEGEYDVFEKLENTNYKFFTQNGTAERLSYTAFYNTLTNRVYKFPKSMSFFKFNNDYSYFIGSENPTILKRNIERSIYFMSDEGISIAYKNVFDGYGYDSIKWIDNETILINEKRNFENEWLNISTKLSFQTTINLGNEVKINEELVSEFPIDEVMGSDEIILYESISNNPQRIKSVELTDIQSSSFVNTIGIVDYKLVLWFEVALIDNSIFYSYREQKNDEKLQLSSIFLVKDDVSLEEVYSKHSGEILTVLDYGVNKGVYVVEEEDFDIKSYTVYYEKVENQNLFYPNYDNSLLLYWENDKLDFQIENIKQNIVNSFHCLYPGEYTFKWINEDTLSLKIINDELIYREDIILLNVNGSWISDSENVYLIE